MPDLFNATFDGFINRKSVTDALDKKERRVLARAGGTARQIMRRGMRRSKKPGPVGGYPNAHSGELRDKIFFNYNQSHGSVSVGPLRLATQPKWLPSGIETVPQLLNQGGTVRRLVHKKQRTFVYKPRPFVDLTIPAAALALVRIYRNTPLRK